MEVPSCGTAFITTLKLMWLKTCTVSVHMYCVCAHVLCVCAHVMDSSVAVHTTHESHVAQVMYCECVCVHM